MTGTRPLLDRIDEWNERMLWSAVANGLRGVASLLVVYGALALFIQQTLYFFTYTIGGQGLAAAYLVAGVLVAGLAFALACLKLLPSLRVPLNPAQLQDPAQAREALQRIQAAPTKVPTELSEGGRTALPELALSLMGLEVLIFDAPMYLYDAWIAWKRRLHPDEDLLDEAEQLIYCHPAPTCSEADARAALLLLRLRVVTLRPALDQPDDRLHVSRSALGLNPL